jgi:hypothetical protein
MTFKKANDFPTVPKLSSDKMGFETGRLVLETISNHEILSLLHKLGTSVHLVHTNLQCKCSLA